MSLRAVETRQSTVTTCSCRASRGRKSERDAPELVRLEVGPPVALPDPLLAGERNLLAERVVRTLVVDAAAEEGHDVPHVGVVDLRREEKGRERVSRAREEEARAQEDRARTCIGMKCSHAVAGGKESVSRRARDEARRATTHGSPSPASIERARESAECAASEARWSVTHRPELGEDGRLDDGSVRPVRREGWA